MSARSKKGDGAAKKLTKAQLMTEIATKTGLTKTNVEAVFDTLAAVLHSELKRTGELTVLPGLVKVQKVKKAARPARPGRNPATGETITISAKPASVQVKVKALKSLKDMV